MSSDAPWPFADPPNTAVIASRSILDGDDWVYYVTHDEEDGAWQFHPYAGPAREEDAQVVSLELMTQLEPRINELADLPLGWHAWRDTKKSSWVRLPKEQDDPAPSPKASPASSTPFQIVMPKKESEE